MDVKKTGAPLTSQKPMPASRQTGHSHNQPSQQPKPVEPGTSAPLQLKTGQQLELLVIKITSTDALLEILGSKVKVRTTDKEFLQSGQRLQARITQTQPTIQLKVLTPKLALNNEILSLINTTLKQVMPKQQPLRNLLDNIQQLTQTNSNISSPLQKIKNSFIQSLPPSQAFEEARILPKIFKRSGLFTEHLLGDMVKNVITQSTFPNNDLKVALLRLANQLRTLQTVSENNISPEQELTIARQQKINTYNPALLQQHQKENLPMEKQSTHIEKHDANKHHLQNITQEHLVDKLLSLADGSLARLQTQQLQQHQLLDAQKPAWEFELPIRTNSSLDNVTIYINKDNTNNNNASYVTPWSLIIKLNIDGLGKVQANVTLQATRISVTFWLENEKTSSLFSEYLQLLEAKFNKAGLEAGNINCHYGKPPHIRTPLQTSTLNEQT